MVSTATPVSALYLGGSLPSTQVFALSTGGQLLSFTALGDGPGNGSNWSVFNLSAISGSGANLTTGPQAIAFGSTVHVYATDSNKHLHDFYKTLSGNWQDIDLTNQTGFHSIFGEPYAYGGNSIQIATTSSGGDLLTVVQTVRPDGTLVAGTPSVTDITQQSGRTEFPRGTPKPVVTGDNTVNIFVDDTHGNLVDFSKTPTGQWQTAVVANVGQVNLTPAPMWSSQLGLHVITNNSAGQTINFGSTAPASDGPPFFGQTLPSGGQAVGDPSIAVISNGGEIVTFSNAT
jgi:hypothetical protein